MRKKFIEFFALKFMIISILLGFSHLPCYGTVTFTDASDEAGVAYSPPMTWGCSFADINNDGYIDIFIPNHYVGEPSLYINNGNGTFSEMASAYGLLREDIVAPDRVAWDSDFHGSAWGDFDNDGDVDLYIACGAGAGRFTEPMYNHLLRNDSTTFSEITEEAGVGDGWGRGRTPIWVDYDNDGNLDLFVTNEARENAPSCLFRNNGDGTFTDVTQSAGLFDLFNNKTNETAVWGDYDQDGDMDLFMTPSNLGPPVLARNNGDGTFTDVTGESGILNVDPKTWKWGTGIVLGDYDNDGDLDLFITQGVDQLGVEWDEDSIKFYTAVAAPNEQFVNFKTTGNQVTFNLETYGYTANMEDYVFIGKNAFNPASLPFTLSDGEAYGIPESPSDVTFLVWQDEDDREWHISMRSSVSYPAIGGTRTGFITSNGSFTEVTDNLPLYKHNTYRSFLFKNNGDGTFTDVTYAAGLTYKGWSASAAWADFDNDGYLDLYIVNFNAFENAPNSFYHNNGDGTFTEMSVSAGCDGMVAGRGDVGIVGDYNNDGFLDIFITNSRTLALFANGPYILYKNDGNSNNWFEIKTIGTISNRDGIGAKVWLTTGNTTQYREQNGGTTLYGQNSPLLYFGLGSASTIDLLKVQWPSGKSQEFTNIAVNQILTLTEPGVTWSEVISAYNEYVSGNKTWADVIATYQLYVKSQL